MTTAKKRRRVKYEVRWNGSVWDVTADGEIVASNRLKARAVWRARCIARQAWRRSRMPGELRIYTKSGRITRNGGASYGPDPRGRG